MHTSQPKDRNLFDENINHKLEVLTKIGKAFADYQIEWAVGGSLLLYFKKRVSSFHDIDLLVAEKNVVQVQQILSQWGCQSDRKPNPKYKTKHFMEFVVEQVDIDVMAGLTIVSAGKEYSFPFSRSSVDGYILLNQVSIPLDSLEQWAIYYDLMGRPEKVELIRDSN